MTKLILASGSPRRREFLEKFGIPFTVAVSGCDETPEPGAEPAEGARLVAERKARAVDASTGGKQYVLAADTIVVLDEEVLGKPASRDEAGEMLRKLSGCSHTVITGVALCRGGRCRSLSVSTAVHFRPLTEAQVRWYVATGEPMDKAGAYALQGAASAFIDSIDGSYTNVIGLPLAETMELLAEAGFAPWGYGA